MAVGRFIGGEGVNFGIPIEIPKAILAGLPAGAAAKPFATRASSALLRNLEISAGVFAAPFLGYWFVAARRRRAARPSGPIERHRPS